MTKQIWKCAGCGTPEPFCCECHTEVCYSDGGRTAWKSDVKHRYSLETRTRWRLFQAMCSLGWLICPEPHRSALQHNMRFDPNWKRLTVVASSSGASAVDKSNSGSNL